MKKAIIAALYQYHNMEILYTSSASIYVLKQKKATDDDIIILYAQMHTTCRNFGWTSTLVPTL